MRAVAFDYGGTLAKFRWDDALWRSGVEAMLAAAGADPALAGRALDALGAGLRRRDGLYPAELDYAGLVAATLAGLGVAVTDGLLRRAIEAEYRAWAPARHVRPGAAQLLDGVRGLGLPVGIAANTFDPPDLFRADLAQQGLAGRADAIVLSCEVGVRKPHPDFLAALAAALGVEPGEVLFVSDRDGVEAIETIVESGTPGKI
jgi:FMN phosphatase YigB (HAD superfamily)